MFGGGLDPEFVGLGFNEAIVLLHFLVEAAEEVVSEEFYVWAEVSPLAVKVDEDIAVEEPTGRQRRHRSVPILYVFQILDGYEIIHLLSG